MQDYQLRVIEEYKELNSKCEKLSTYLFKISDDLKNLVENTRLATQLKYMTGYRNVLRDRIADFNK